MPRAIRSLITLFGVATILVLSAMPARANIVFNTFATPNTAASNAPIGFAYAGNKFVGSYYNTDGSGNTVLYSTNLNGGNVQPFGTSINIPTLVPEEHFVASSLGLGGFPSRDIYVGAVGQVIHITNNGASGGPFVTGLSGEVRAILFDPVGTFGNQMLVSTSTGSIYQVSSAGKATLIANIGADTEGMDIAPLGGGFGTFDGDLFVASDTTGTIRAIDPNTHLVSTVVHVDSAEQISFVPLNLGASGSPLEGLYSADYPVDVIKANASQFKALLGDLIVTGETTHNVTDVHFNGSSFVLTAEGSFPNQPEDGIFVTTAIIQAGSAVPEPATFTLFGVGLLGAAVAARIRRYRRCNS